MKLEFKLHSINARIPTKAHDIDAGFDLYATHNTNIGRSTLIDTEVSVNIPEGYVGLIFSRSGMGARGIRLSNCVGVIDSGYHGHLGIMLTDDSPGPYGGNTIITAGDKVAQLVILQLPQVELELVEEFSTKSARGVDGFGSSGQ